LSDTNLKSEQHVWPIFLIALLLGVLGFALALNSTPSTLPAGHVEAFDIEQPLVEKIEKKTTLPFSNQSKKYKVFIQQEGVKSKKHTLTRLSFELIEEKKSDTILHRSFKNAAVEIYGDTKTPLHPEVSFDVALLIETIKYEIKVDTHNHRGATLISSDPGKLRSVLRLIQESLSLAFVQTPGEKVKSGDKWFFSVKEGEDILYSGERQLLGKNEKAFVIKQQMHQQKTIASTPISLSGSGTTLVNMNDGGLESATITLQSIAEIEGNKFVSSTRILLKAIH